MKKKKKRKQKKKEAAVTVPEAFHEAMVKALGMDKWPGDPSNRTILATEATDSEVRRAFKDNPSSKWVVTPTCFIERETFFKETPK